MISIKRYLDSSRDELLRCALASCRGVLEAVGKSSMQACPPISVSLEQSLMNLRDRLSEETTPGAVQEMEAQATAELCQWGIDAAEYYKQQAAEIKELLSLMAAAAESAGDRDQRYVGQVQEFTGRLEGIADLQDLSEMRDSLIKNAIELKACAERMTQETRESSAQLHRQLASYQARLDEVERLAGADPLTGLDNRRKVEASIECRLQGRRAFCIVMMDLNGFKRINDEYGHEAGDEVLKQFAAEVRSVFRATDVVGRWGGDEFLVVLDGGVEAARSQVDRLSKWTLGEYRIRAKGSTVKLTVDAAIGVTAFHKGDDLKSLVARADAAMYEDKKRNRKKAGPAR